MSHIAGVTNHRDEHQGLRPRESQLADLLDQLHAHHPLTYEHCRRVASLSRQMAMLLGMGHTEVVTVFSVGLLHDIGHLQTPAELLSKREELTADDWEILHGHPAVGAALLENLIDDATVARCVGEHHERPDGQGYPAGNRKLHPATAIVSVASTFDTITFNRWLQRWTDRERALEEIRRVTGSQLEETAVHALFSLLNEPW